MTIPYHTANGDATATRLQPSTDVGVREIPYDYVATFELTGQVGHRLQDVINVSVEGAFVAAAIGYSFLPPRGQLNQPIPQPGAIARGRARRANRLAAGNAASAAAAAAPNVLNAIRSFLGGLLLPPVAGAPVVLDGARAARFVDCFERYACGLDFLYSVIDSGSGRELQNQPIHNIAGLGSPHGERPFRVFAKPMLFQPRSSIRIEIIEQSEGDIYEGSTLYFVLHGYKILGHGVPR